MVGLCHRWWYNWDPGKFLAFWGILLALGVAVEAEKCVMTDAPDGSRLCECYKVYEPPWSDKEVEVAPQPESVLVKFEMKTPIRANISWTYQGQHISDVEGGFYLEIYVTEGDSSSFVDNLYYNCDVVVHNLTRLAEPFTSFYFEDCCLSWNEEDGGFQAGDEVMVKAHARPMYNVDDQPYYAKNSSVVPEAPRRKDRHPNKRRNDRHPNKRRKDRHPKKRKKRGSKHREIKIENENIIDDLKIAIAVLLTAFFCCIIAVICWCIKQRRRCGVKRNGVERRRILLVGDGEDERYAPLLNQIFELLKKYGRGNTEITANTRRVTEIARESLIGWTTRNVSEADIVICVITNPKQVRLHAESPTVSHVSVTLRVLESKILQSSVKSAGEKFLALDAVSCESLPFCSHYSLQRDLKKLVRHALGPHYQYAPGIEDSNALLQLLSNAENAPKDPGAVRKRRVPLGDESKLLNNLDESLSLTLLDGSYPSMVPNITQEPPSIENNSCK